MKIVFLCGCLEPGKDGVGDYTRRLAGEFCRRGHESFAVAINDHFVTTKLDEIQKTDGTNLPVFRVPDTFSKKLRYQYVEEKIEKIDPAWISLQFVPFSFHPKGLSLEFVFELVKVGKGRRWHIMFHELWVISNFTMSKKNWLLGHLQMRLIKQLIKGLKPAAIHTHTRLYQKRLKQLGFVANYLPLFSNIPVTNDVSLADDRNTSRISIVNFGAIYPNSMFEKFSEEAVALARRKGLEIRLIFIGRPSAELEKWVAICRNVGFDYELMGEQSAENVSRVLANATIGISTTPYTLVEKSGSVAAMIEHHLPVLCISKPWLRAGLEESESVPGVQEYKHGMLDNFLLEKRSNTMANNLSTITNKLIECLN